MCFIQRRIGSDANIARMNFCRWGKAAALITTTASFSSVMLWRRIASETDASATRPATALQA